MASSERLQNEILLKEEAFLKEQRAKLTEQLNKLKVRLLALSRFSRLENCTVEVFFGSYDGKRQKMYNGSRSQLNNKTQNFGILEFCNYRALILHLSGKNPSNFLPPNYGIH